MSVDNWAVQRLKNLAARIDKMPSDANGSEVDSLLKEWDEAEIPKQILVLIYHIEKLEKERDLYIQALHQRKGANGFWAKKIKEALEKGLKIRGEIK